MERHQWRATIGQQIADPIPKPPAELQPALPVQMWQVDERTVVQLTSKIEQRRLIAWKTASQMPLEDLQCHRGNPSIEG